MHKGSCLCGDVQFEIKHDLEAPVACHCSQCRKTSGHFWAAVHATKSDFALTEDSGLKWYDSSSWARRGFCGTCGSSLFYDMKGEDFLSVAAGTLDSDFDVKIGRHIFCADKGKYYEINDDVTQLDQY